MIKVLVMPPNGPSEVKEVEGKLETYQELVGGYIEAVPFFPVTGVLVICDEEGKLKGKEINFYLRDRDGDPVDILVGTAVFIGRGEEDFTSLTDEQIAQIKEALR